MLLRKSTKRWGTIGALLTLVLVGCGPQSGEGDVAGPSAEAPSVGGPATGVGVTGDTPSVLLIVLDTFRADALGSYGNPLAETPHLDGLAEGGVLFENAMAQAPATGPSVASILTARYPVEHGVLHSTLELVDDEVTAAEVFAQAGHRTAAFVSCSILKRDYGFSQGFDTFDDTFETPYMGNHLEQDGRVTVDKALEWLNEDPERPFFALVHLFDAHAPYVQHDGDRPIDPKMGDPEFLRTFEANPGGVDEILPEVQALYRSEVAHIDRQVGRLLGALETLGLSQDTVVAVVADHGEELFDHDGYFAHYKSLYGSVLHVPMILHGPPWLPQGRRIDSLVETVDLLPTVFEVVGLAFPSETSGRGLLAQIQQDGAPRGRRFARAQREPYEDLEGGLALAIRSQRYKLIAFAEAPDRLFDLHQDPGELEDLAPQLPDVVARLRTELDPWWEALGQAGETDQGQLPAKDFEVLESLGYVQ